MIVGHLLSHVNYFSLFHKIMDENQLNKGAITGQESDSAAE